MKRPVIHRVPTKVHYLTHERVGEGQQMTHRIASATVNHPDELRRIETQAGFAGWVLPTPQK